MLSVMREENGVVILMALKTKALLFHRDAKHRLDSPKRGKVHKQLRGQLDAYEPKRSMRYQRALFFPTQKTGMFNSKITNFKVE